MRESFPLLFEIVIRFWSLTGTKVWRNNRNNNVEIESMEYIDIKSRVVLISIKQLNRD